MSDEMMELYPKIQSVRALPNKQLWVTFQNEVNKVYDCKPLLEKRVFAPLQDEQLFWQVKVDQGGYGVSWNDDLDLSEAELWLNGVEGAVEMPASQEYTVTIEGIVDVDHASPQVFFDGLLAAVLAYVEKVEGQAGLSMSYQLYDGEEE